MEVICQSSPALIFFPHRFHVDNNKGKLGIFYDMIIVGGLMEQLGLLDSLKSNLLQCHGDEVSAIEWGLWFEKNYLTKHKIRKLVMQTEETDLTKENT